MTLAVSRDTFSVQARRSRLCAHLLIEFVDVLREMVGERL